MSVFNGSSTINKSNLLHLINLTLENFHILLNIIILCPRILPLTRHLRLHIIQTNRHTKFLVSWPRLVNHIDDFGVGIYHPIAKCVILDLEVFGISSSLLYRSRWGSGGVVFTLIELCSWGKL